MIVNIALYSTFAVSSILTPNLTTDVKSSVQEVSAIDRLKMGNQRFVDDKAEHNGQDSTRRMEGKSANIMGHPECRAVIDRPP